jgi:hypothetical protein
MSEYVFKAPARMNFDRLVDDLRAAGCEGARTDGDGEIVVVVDGDETGTAQADIQTILDAHDASVLTPGQQKAARAAEALEELGQADFAAWRDVMKNGTAAQKNGALIQLGRVVWLLLQAQGLTDTADLD